MWRFIKTARLYILALPVLISFLGAASNQLVIIANHDKFPVMVNARNTAAHGGADESGMMDDVHCLMTADTHLNFLADIFDFHSEIASIGDLMIDAGNYLSPFAPVVWGCLLIGDLRRRDGPSER